MDAGKDLRVSHDKFTKFEMARVIGSRALQISHGAPILIKLTQKQLEDVKFNPIEIAKLEFAQGKIPITVMRPLPNED